MAMKQGCLRQTGMQAWPRQGVVASKALGISCKTSPGSRAVVQFLPKRLSVDAKAAAEVAGGQPGLPEQQQDEPAAGGVCPRHRNIVVAVDSSEDSKYACQWVVDHLYRPGDVVHALHVTPHFPSEGLYSLPDGRLAVVNFDRLAADELAYHEAAARAAEDVCWAAFGPSKVHHVVEVVDDQSLFQPGGSSGVGDAICARAEELAAAAVVVAAHAKSALAEAALGSVANHCVHHCAVPVLVLHAPRHEHGGGGPGAWLASLLSRLAVPGAAEGRQAEAEEAAAVEQVGFDEEGEVLFSEEGEEDRAGGIVSSADFPPSEEESNIIGAVDAMGQGAPSAAAPAAEAQRQEQGEFRGQSVPVERKIVIAVDDSDASQRACVWAVQNLFRPGDTFHLLHIIPALPLRAYGGPATDGFVFYASPPTDDYRAAVELYVDARFAGMLRAAGVPYEADIIAEPTDGSVEGVGRAICRVAEELDAAAVVVGSQLRGGLAEFMLGSVASHLEHHCSRPVAVLH